MFDICCKEPKIGTVLLEHSLAKMTICFLVAPKKNIYRIPYHLKSLPVIQKSKQVSFNTT